jgi:hypothetical protein
MKNKFRKPLPPDDPEAIESDLQRGIVDWLRLVYPTARFCRIKGEVNIKDDDKRNRTINVDYRMGFEKGFPDFGLFHGAKYEFKSGKTVEYRGLFIEFKSPKGGWKILPEQAVWHEKLRKNGYMVLVIDNYAKGKKAIHDYLSHDVDEINRNLVRSKDVPKRPREEVDSDVEEVITKAPKKKSKKTTSI